MLEVIEYFKVMFSPLGWYVYLFVIFLFLLDGMFIKFPTLEYLKLSISVWSLKEAEFEINRKEPFQSFYTKFLFDPESNSIFVAPNYFSNILFGFVVQLDWDRTQMQVRGGYLRFPVLRLININLMFWLIYICLDAPWGAGFKEKLPVWGIWLAMVLIVALNILFGARQTLSLLHHVKRELKNVKNS